ncbi:prepilin peptidase [Actinokineospora diospyrosa]|uniref:Leader peptidase (Prepilin peptidase) / N-methyltransferase n=1 Tax=Actinokineospora diospyrosa TaxID=103728 RepID=A0ABT1I5Q8_9PSEU|nr:A24 family peptidase [Actinokineospora diospyrosa]MCP2267959.1 leader peptidase (prepilin peptidase) / N-methyltransferase [Actinokineospora diospyrosa]
MEDWIFIGVWTLVGTVVTNPANTLVRSLGASTSTPVNHRLVTACGMAVYALLAARLGMGATLVAYSVLVSLIIPLAAIDLREHRLPTKPIVVTAAAIAILFAGATAANRQPEPLLRSLACAAVCLMVLTTAYLITPGFIGGGDIRLVVLLMLALGWTGWTAAVQGIAIGLLVGAVHALVRLADRGRSGPRHIPLGPALVLGTLGSILIN